MAVEPDDASTRVVIADTAVADAVQKQRASQAMLQAARRMGRFILEVDRNTLEPGKERIDQMRVC